MITEQSAEPPQRQQSKILVGQTLRQPVHFMPKMVQFKPRRVARTILMGPQLTIRIGFVDSVEAVANVVLGHDVGIFAAPGGSPPAMRSVIPVVVLARGVQGPNAECQQAETLGERLAISRLL
jgi:hypothetical protein